MRKSLQKSVLTVCVVGAMGYGSVFAADMPVYTLDTVTVTAQAYEKKELERLLM